ncbi:S9 family peptidase [Azospirillum sp. B4]|uniref:alpha/beta hydrolase family protein n=1 Tax=Azospirillum sp. B4 TaxID=95605 RepID=UPI0011DDB383|nr:hypothetical protein [Azospirillum sp. B4]
MAAGRVARRVAQGMVLAALVPLCGCFFAARQGVKALRGDKHAAAPAACDGSVLPPGLPAGADGPYAMVQHPVPDPAMAGQDLLVFLPEHAPGPSPVIFLAHGFGPNRWPSYEGLIRHMVSRGAVVVYAPYPAFGATHDQRYDALWGGFKAAVAAEGRAMDLTRVGIVGHSYGGGAVPFLAARVFGEQGWGGRGAFTLALAPWYSYRTGDADMARLPPHVLQGWQVYDGDTMNDQRMAVDLYRHAPPAGGRHFFQAASGTLTWPQGPADGCPLVADHRTPGLGDGVLMKRLAVYPVVDALADQAFVPSADTAAKLAALGQAGAGGYHPLVREAAPTAAKPQDAYVFPWTHPQNPRQGEGAP